MLTTLALAALIQTSPLAVVPDDAYLLVHGRDLAALRARAEANDWVRLLGTDVAAPFVGELARTAHGELNELLAVARALEGETVLFDTGRVAGFATRPPADRAALVAAMRAWLPGEDAERRTLEAAGARVELLAWPEAIDGWDGRAGHFAAWLERPDLLAVWSGDDAEAVGAAVRDALAGLAVDRRAPLVAQWRERGGGASAGLELYVDFSPLVDDAEDALAAAVREVLPSPAGLLGLERGAWLFASADVAPGTPLDVRARLAVPPDTLAARLADTWHALPATLPADLPADVWAFEAWNWDVARAYALVREAYQEATDGKGWAKVDAGVEGAKGLTGVDPVADVLAQLSGVGVLYALGPEAREGDPKGDNDALRTARSLGLQLGLRDGDAFLSAVETLLEVGGLAEAFESDEIEGADVYLFDAVRDERLDGGLAFLPHAFAVSPARATLERSLRALARVEGASLVSGAPMTAVIDGEAGACFLACLELSALRALVPDEVAAGLELPPLGDAAARDPFEARLISSVRRTGDGFEAWLRTR